MQKKRDCDFSINDRAELISQWEFGARLDKALRLRLVAGSSVIDFRPRRTVYRAGDQADCLYAIASGRIKLSRRENGTAREAVIDILPEGVLLGESALYSQAGTRENHALAYESSRLLKFPVGDFRDAMLEDREL